MDGSCMIGIASAVSAVSAVAIATLTFFNYRLSKGLKLATETEREANAEFRRQATQLYEYIILANAKSGRDMSEHEWYETKATIKRGFKILFEKDLPV